MQLIETRLPPFPDASINCNPQFSPSQKPAIKSSPLPYSAMALLLQPSLSALFFLIMAFSPALSFPWNSSHFDKSGWNPSYEELLPTSGETSGRRYRRKNTIFGAPCGLCGQVIFGSEALTHHYNYHFLQNQLASSGRSQSQPSTSRLRPPPWTSYFHGQSSASRQPQMTLNDYLAQPRQLPSLRRYSGAAVDMAHAHQLPLHPLLAQHPPRTASANGINGQQNQFAAGQLGQRMGTPTAEQQPPQDVIDVNSEEHECNSDGSEDLDLTLSL